MKEHQHIEWKESWRDEHLKWISGFANAQGGVLVIGRNDKGKFEFPYSAAYIEIIPGEAARRDLGERVGEKVGERVGEKLTANQQRILDLLSQHARMTAPVLAQIVGISKRKIEQNVATLKRMGRLRRVGPAKGGQWEVLK